MLDPTIGTKTLLSNNFESKLSLKIRICLVKTRKGDEMLKSYQTNVHHNTSTSSANQI